VRSVEGGGRIDRRWTPMNADGEKRLAMGTGHYQDTKIPRGYNGRGKNEE